MEDGWEAGGIRAGIRTWENSLPQMPGLAHEWALLCFPRKAVHASMCSSGQHTGGPARCGSQTEEDWACHLEGDI